MRRTELLWYFFKFIKSVKEESYSAKKIFNKTTKQQFKKLTEIKHSSLAKKIILDHCILPHYLISLMQQAFSILPCLKKVKLK